MLVIYLCFVLSISSARISRMQIISSPAYEFLPINSIEFILSTRAPTRLRCAVVCHQQSLCRTFDYDSLSHRCRLYEGDLTTGSTILSSLIKSVVVSVKITSDLYSTSHNQGCQACANSRYEQCLNNMCQCLPHTYWNGSECLCQLFNNQTCAQTDACRTDLNLTCVPTYQNTFTKCAVTTLAVGTTVAGLDNGTAGSANDTLNLPRGIVIINNGNTLIVSEEGNKRVQSYNLSLPKPAGSILIQTPNAGEYPSFVMDYNNSLYVGIPGGNRVLIWPSNTTLPPSSPYNSNCIPQNVVAPAGIQTDGNGSIYITNQDCHCVSRWKGSSGSVIAGVLNSMGNTSEMLWYPAGIYIDQDKALYVADTYNHRIQKFIPLGNQTGVTVAGGNGLGSASNQLNNPLHVYVSPLTGSIYVSDHGNHRIQRWDINATQGVTVAGNPSGISGNTSVDLNGPFSILLYPSNETFLYVADWNNHRVLRFPLL